MKMYGEGADVAAPRRGEVYLVSFDPTLGAEIKKTRPALVIQNDVGNRYSPITIVAAITRAGGLGLDCLPVSSYKLRGFRTPDMPALPMNRERGDRRVS